MDACGMTSEEVTIAEMKMSMVDYCLNVLRKRTIDEQLVDFSGLTKSTLVQRIEYRKTGIKVSYTIGSLNASVDGLDELTCVRQCKVEILQELKSFCSYTNRRVTQTILSSDLKARDVRTAVYGKTARKAVHDTVLVVPELDIPEEVWDFTTDSKSPLVLHVSHFPAEREIDYVIGPYAARRSAKPSTCVQQCKTLLLNELRTLIRDAKARAGKNVVDREAVVGSADLSPTISPEDGDSRGNEKPHSDENVLAIAGGKRCEPNKEKTEPAANESVTRVEPEITNSKAVSTGLRGTTDQQIGKPLSIIRRAQKTNNVSENELIGENQQYGLINKTNGPAIEPTAAVELAETTSRMAVPGTGCDQQPNRSFDTPEQYVDRASEVLRNVWRNAFCQSADRFFQNLVHAFLAGRPYLKRITDCVVSNAIDKPDNCAVYAELCSYAIGKAREDPRVTVRQGMTNAFKADLIKSCRDVLTQAGVSTVVASGRRARNAGQSERLDPRARERTHGTCRLMGELFMRDLMFKTVMNAAEAFMQIHDAHSLECLCVILIIIGPKLEKAIDDPRRLYQQLDNYSAAGYAGHIPLPRRTVHMIDAALNVQKCYARTRRGVSAARKTDDRDRCSRPVVTESPDHHRADRRTAPAKGILRHGQNRPPSGTGAEPAQQPKKRVTFNPRTSILCFPRNQ